MDWIKLLIFCSMLCFCCSKQNTETSQISPALSFVKSGNYKILFKKGDIPKAIVDSLGRENQEVFRIGDHTDGTRFDFGCAQIIDPKNPRYSTRLNFLLVNDSSCLLVYTQGGFARYDVIDYFKYNVEFRRWRYTSSGEVRNTIELTKFLEANTSKEISCTAHKPIDPDLLLLRAGE